MVELIETLKIEDFHTTLLKVDGDDIAMGSALKFFAYDVSSAPIVDITYCQVRRTGFW